MHLKQVTMENFKSIDRRIVVPFEPGFTGITGPNGSGKSNIGDAILFVLGPNSPRAIRAGRLTDLIFNGGEHGKPAKECTVTLTFDNTDRTMPVDADDVHLSRRVARRPKPDDPEGYTSKFYVNGKASQKREFVNLLEHARIAADGYNITKQGDVQAIVEMGPVERRKIVDQMAGITQFDRDIDQANQERERVEENLGTLSIVLEEVERNLKDLEKEKAQAARMMELRTQLQTVRGQLAHRKLKAAERNLAELIERMERAKQERQKMADRHQELSEQYREAREEHEHLAEEVRRQGGERVKEVQEQLKEAVRTSTKALERLNYLKDQVTDLREKDLPLKEQERKLEKAYAEIEKELGALREELATKRQEEAAATEKFDSIQRTIRDAQGGNLEIQAKLQNLRHRYDAAQDQLAEAKRVLERSGSDLSEDQERYERAKGDLESAKTDLEEMQERLKDLTDLESKATKGRKETAQRQAELKIEIGKKQKTLNELTTAIRRMAIEEGELEGKMRAAESSGQQASRAVLAILENKTENPGVLGTVGELIGAEDDHAVAIQIAAGGNLQALICKDDEAAAKGIEFLKRQRLGRAKFLPLTKMVPGRPRGQALMKKSQPGCLGFALDLVNFSEQYRNAMWHVFGDTLVAENLAAARRMMGGVRIVTLDGELIEAGGAMVGGSLGAQTKKASFNVGAGRDELDALKAKKLEAEHSRDAIEDEIILLEREIDQITQEDDVVMLQEDKEELERIRAALPGRQQQVLDLRNRMESLAKAMESYHASRVDAELKESEAKDRLDALEEERKQIQKVMLAGTRKELRDESERLGAKSNELRQVVADLATKVAVAQERCQTAKRDLDDLQAARKELQDELVAKDGEEKRCQNDLKAAQTAEQALTIEEQEISNSLGAIGKKKEAAYQKMVDLHAQAQRFEENRDTQDTLLLRYRGDLPSLEEQVAEARQEAMEHTLDESEELPDMDTLRRKERTLDRAIDDLGDVNMLALEQYEAQHARQLEIQGDMQRLLDEKSGLESLVDEISIKRKAVFMGVFDKLDANMAETYKRLSGGGRANLLLENAEDPFAGGLTIRAQPVGKKVNRLESLSGGEKSLCSMAFIFALQQYDPSCFYYLDEVDQNLDALNADLLAQMVRDQSEFAQFIVVSLRKVTLKEADRVFGVTQVKAGVSEIIANFDIGKMADAGDGDSEESLDTAIKQAIGLEATA